MEKQILQDQYNGMVEKGKQLREKEAVFLKAQGIKEQIEKTRIEAEGLEEDLEKIKKDLKAKIEEKNSCLEPTILKLQERMNEVLPEGNAIFQFNEGKITLGLLKKDQFRSYAGLSGGEKIAFDTALIHTLGSDIIIQECAELDNQNMETFLDKILETAEQVILCSCHKEFEVPKEFNIVSY